MLFVFLWNLAYAERALTNNDTIFEELESTSPYVKRLMSYDNTDKTKSLKQHSLDVRRRWGENDQVPPEA